ncbi:TadE/TadG family type IV pilus assembly protein [uncultured Vibrio sp.]|uniref:TadE/TadG family type IV pilus assembly protein n=1 Tax=uncultured Vibrio sp. TaxID=114054 RepID=UPI00091DDCD6|nr:TadE family protein [uncultured Vibrio sp.]OIQ25099.1 MAG: pilus assembly protein TadE [Vibrio sp. MedPE-SWchi]
MRSKQRGVASIEFAVGFFAFWLMCMAWVEMSYISYISAINDLAISEVARTAKKGSGHYLETVEQVLHRDNSIWNQVVDGDNFQVTIHYTQGIEALTSITDQCMISDNQKMKECGDSELSSLAIYRINYRFMPIFSYFFTTQNLMSREMIVVQEYERSKFEI